MFGKRRLCHADAIKRKSAAHPLGHLLDAGVFTHLAQPAVAHLLQFILRFVAESVGTFPVEVLVAIEPVLEGSGYLDKSVSAHIREETVEGCHLAVELGQRIAVERKHESHQELLGAGLRHQPSVGHRHAVLFPIEGFQGIAQAFLVGQFVEVFYGMSGMRRCIERSKTTCQIARLELSLQVIEDMPTGKAGHYFVDVITLHQLAVHQVYHALRSAACFLHFGSQKAVDRAKHFVLDVVEGVLHLFTLFLASTLLPCKIQGSRTHIQQQTICLFLQMGILRVIQLIEGPPVLHHVFRQVNLHIRIQILLYNPGNQVVQISFVDTDYMIVIRFLIHTYLLSLFCCDFAKIRRIGN